MSDSEPANLTFVQAIKPVVASESGKAIAPEVAAIAKHAAQRHGSAVKAVLFYGSCLRDAVYEDRLVDLYLVVDDYRRAHRRWLEAAGNRLIPPNVYYVECGYSGLTLRAKYAVIALEQLTAWVQPTTLNPYFWARFAQPFRILLADDHTADRLAAMGAQAIATTIATGPQNRGDWAARFAQTYCTELRSEKPNRPNLIVERHPGYYQKIDACLDRHPVRAARHQAWLWRVRTWQGKGFSVLRLIKAAFTFQGGADYLVWKVQRHSGVAIELSDWQRRHPILAAPFILWRLKRLGAVR